MLSAKSECQDRLVLLGEGHLRKAIQDYMAHYHGERNHQGLGGQIIRPEAFADSTAGPVECRDRLGGLLRLPSGVRMNGGRSSFRTGRGNLTRIRH